MKRIRLDEESKKRLRPKRYSRTGASGHPPFEPTDQQRLMVAECIANLMDRQTIMTMIETRWGIGLKSYMTFNKYFKKEIDAGLAEAKLRNFKGLKSMAYGRDGVFEIVKRKGKDGKVIEEIVWTRRPLAPDLGAMIWLDKTRFGMKDVQGVEHTGKDGEPLDLAPKVVVYLPANGRETIVQGQVIEQRAITHSKLNGHANGEDKS